MDKETKTIIELAKAIKNYCVHKETCADCPFATTYNICALNNPINYQPDKAKES